MKVYQKLVLAAVALGAGPGAHAATLAINFADAIAYGAEGAPGNTVLTRFIGADARITGISYTATITAGTPEQPNWLWDQGMSFGSSTSPWMLVKPGYDRAYTGTEAFDGFVDLEQLGADFFLDPDGILKIEFFDSYNTTPVALGRWRNGTLGISYDSASITGSVPEPGTWIMMMIGFGAVACAMRYRQRGPRLQRT